MAKIFIVNYKDLINKKRNPNLSLSPKQIIKNLKIPKVFLDKKR